ncbi:hypothetical protein B0H67DRAFT_549926 [Lasiosphaeris hirsuta]|uniref:Uncharacterized protein n=1 Tax=Lasiosphaeris hirsuta TaxID=260670 RepID=A0AA40E143_9PEZI|nr:hypothetical protein B0H67DRAFT_549926 [Lasiosphaeris hirsuta]
MTTESGAPVTPTHESPEQQQLFQQEHQQEHESPLQPLIDTRLSWRPFYLRRAVVLAFATAFAAILIAIEVLLALSDKNDGLGTGNRSQQYLWAYGPTALLTIVSALWGRTEYQSKVAAPWIQLSRLNKAASQTLLLDYLADWQPYSAVKAFRNGDYVVSIAATVSMVLKMLIVLSTGLISLSWTTVTRDSYPLTVQDAFVGKLGPLQGDIGWYTLLGVVDGNLSYPAGLSEDYAFQSTGAEGLPGTAETRAVVDGFENSLDCEPAGFSLEYGEPWEVHRNLLMRFSLTSTGCNVTGWESRGPYKNSGEQCNGGYEDSRNCTMPIARFEPVQCDGVEGEAGRRMLPLFANTTWFEDFSKNYTDGRGVTWPTYNMSIPASAQLLCVPTYSIGPVEVVSNRSSQRVRPVPGGAKRTLESVNAWSIMDAYLENLYTPASQSEGLSSSYSGNFSGITLSYDYAMLYALRTSLPPDIPATNLYDPAFLQGLITDHYRQAAAPIVKSNLMQPTEVQITGSMVMDGDRIVVRTWAAQTMAALTGFCLIMAAVASFLVPRKGLLPQGPSTIPGLASMLVNSPDLSEALRLCGDADGKSLGRILQSSAFQSGVASDPISGQPCFVIRNTQRKNSPDMDKAWPQFRSLHAHPLIFHPATRTALSLVLCGLIIALELLLRKSNKDQGLGDAGDDAYIHYTWTAIPAIAFGLLSITISAMDFKTRSLAPYAALQQPVDTRQFMSLDFLDMSMPRAIWREARLVNIGTLAITIAFLIASFFTTFSASLFRAQSLPIVSSALLRVNSSFDPELNGISDYTTGMRASLILENNASYPKFTHGDMAFLQLLPPLSTDLDPQLDAENLVTEAVVPAVRGRMECRDYDGSQIQINHTTGYNDLGRNDPLGVSIDGESCGRIPGDEYLSWRHDAVISTYPNMTYFGAAKQTWYVNADHEIRGCSDLLYIWGRMDNSTTPQITHIAAMGCNVSFEALDVATTFVGPSLDMDPTRPPRPLTETVRPSSVPPRSPYFSAQEWIYHSLAAMPSGADNLDAFFSTLVTSRWALPRPLLGAPAAAPAVRDAIKLHHGIILAQLLNVHRLPANETNATLADPRLGDSEAELVINATITEPDARRRVIQDGVATRIMQATLGATLVLLVVNWVWNRDGDAVLGGSPTSVAVGMALVCGGNLLEVLPSGAEWIRNKEMETALAGGGKTSFWMGWGKVEDEEGRERGGENEGGVSRFGIFRIPGDDDMSDGESGALEGREGRGSSHIGLSI